MGCVKRILSAFICLVIIVSTVLFCAAEDEPMIEIRTPSVTKINYGDTLILHADIKDGELTEGWSVVWRADGEELLIEPTFDGMECYVTASLSGEITVTATLVDPSGNEFSDTVELKSRGGFFFRFLFLLRRIFLSPKLHLESF